jgi:hypothetical protein
MLIEKRKRFEMALNILEERCLTGTGWLDSFKKASVSASFFKCAEAYSLFSNNIRECRRHGEAGSANLEAVEAERQRMEKIMVRYEPEDRWNADETSFFPSAPPDRTLCAAPVAGEKQDKFRLSVLVACNSTGTEKEDLTFIGRFANPRPFKGKNPARIRPSLYYRTNKKAWMTGVLWEEYVSSAFFYVPKNAN